MHFIDSGTMSDGTTIHTTRICDMIASRRSNATIQAYDAITTMTNGPTQ